MIGLFVDEHYNEIVTIMPVLLLLAGMFFSVRFDPYMQKHDRRIMYVIGVLVFSLILENYLDYLLDSETSLYMLRRVVDIYGYSIRPVILLLFLHIVDPEKDYRPGWILIGINAALYMTALFSNICFTIDENNKYQGGLPVIKDSCIIVSMLLITFLLYQSLHKLHISRRKEFWIPVLVVGIILVSLFVDLNVHNVRQPVTFLTISIAISCMLYYIWLHFRFVDNYENALVERQRIQLMMTQIQPHFLYNTLATIRSLCRKSPETAAEVIEKFSRYLRQNLNMIDQENMISLKQELEHVRIYTDIEIQMFPYIHVEYDIEDDEFLLPVLTVQPIIENSFRHGVRAREDGIINISSRKADGCHQIVISDNGLGFDTDILKEKQGDHIGIRNIRERLETICGGTLDIRSVPGEGTTVIINIPETYGKEGIK